MADFLFNEEEQKQPTYEIGTKTINERIQETEQKQQQHLDNVKKYNIDAPDEIYKQLESLAESEDGYEDTAEARLLRGTTAWEYSKNLNIPFDEAYRNEPAFNAAVWGDDVFVNNRKSNFKAVKDMFTYGSNNLKIDRLANDLMQAELNNDTELAKGIRSEIEAVEQENMLLQDYSPRNGFVDALKTIVQSTPYTLDVMAAGAIGSIVGASGFAAWAESSYLSRGGMYWNLVKNYDITPQTASKVSSVVGVLEGIAESTVGEASNWLIKSGMTGVGNQLAKTGAKELSEYLGKQFALSNGWKKCVEIVGTGLLSSTGEAAEEGVQEIEEIIGENIAYWLEGKGVPNDNAGEIAKQIIEATKGGFIGSLGFGTLEVGINAGASLYNINQINKSAENTPSKEMFVNDMMKERTDKDGNTYRYSDVFTAKNDEELKNTLGDIWENKRKEVNAQETLRAKEIAEVNPTNEGYENITTDEETGETNAQPVYRDNGQLYTKDVVVSEEDGVQTKSFRAGDPTQESKNLYGNIEYTENGNEITITNFEMNSEREGLRGEVFEQFAQQHAGQNISWDARLSEAQNIREELINNNPRGKNNGLNYYESVNNAALESEVTDARTRKEFAKQIKKYAPNITDEQIPLAMSIIEIGGKTITGKNLTQYLNDHFTAGVFGNVNDLTKNAAAVNEQAKGNEILGATIFKDIADFTKATVYIGEHGDLTTLLHETAHGFRRQLSLNPELQAMAEEAFQVQNGDWNAPTFRTVTGEMITPDEALAYGFEDYLTSGKAQNEQMRTIFDKLAQFFAQLFNALKSHVSLTPEIQEFYDKLLQGDDSILAKAQAAVLANQKQETDTVVNGSIKQDTTTQLHNAENVEKQKVERLVEGTEKEITENLTATNMADSYAEEIAAILSDENASIEEKAEAIEDAAEDALLADDALFQLIKWDSVKEIADRNIQKQLATELKSAMQMEEDSRRTMSDYTETQIMERIKAATGWEKINGEWKYETDDSLNSIKGTKQFNALMQLTPSKLVDVSLNREMKLGDYIEAEQLFKMFPWLKDCRLEFTSDTNTAAPHAELTAEGVVINLAKLDSRERTEFGLIGVLSHEIQHLIQANEHAHVVKNAGSYKELYQGLYDAAQDLDISGSFDQMQLVNMPDAVRNQSEIEARRVARRVVKSYDEKRHSSVSSESDISQLPSYADIHFQLIGKLGASNLDRAEEVTTRMDNLKIAEEMEKAGKDAKTVRLATGWEKGVDGKYRYETDDLQNKFDLIDKVLDFEKNNPKFREYSEKLWASYDGGAELTEEEIKEFDALADEANAYYDKKEVKLKDILDAPQLYKAYPQLKEMEVKFVNDPLNTVKASYAVGKDLWTGEDYNYIQINNIPNSINVNEYENILLHELQHAIQEIEGFAIGGSIQSLVQNFKTKIHSRMNEAYKKYYSDDELQKDYSEYRRLFNKVAKSSNDDFMAAYDELFKFEDSHENVKNFNKELEQARKDLKLDNNIDAAPLFNGRITDTYYDREYSEIVDKLAKDYYNFSAIDDYKALAGEVEARNVQTRMNMSPAERLNTLISDTMDVAPEEQIVMYDAMEMASVEEESNNLNEILNKESEIVENKDHLSKDVGESIVKQWSNIVNDFDLRSAELPVSTIGKIFAHKGYDISTIINDIPELYKTSKRILSEKEVLKDGHKKHPNIEGYYHYLNKFLDSNGDEYFIRFSLYEEKKRKSIGRSLIHSTFISDVGIYKNGAEINTTGIIAPGENFKTPIDYKLQSIINSVNQNVTEDTESTGDTDILFQVVKDPEEIKRLEAEPTVKAYRAMQQIDGGLYPPMSAKVGKELRAPVQLGQWERADENPAMATDDGFFTLDKGNGKKIQARYNPYFHSSPTMLNDQFSEAQDRPNLVTVEVEIPASELNGENPYKAEKAKDAVGTKQWKAGIIQAQLTGTREVNLSRWDKPIRIVPNDEVAENIIKTFGGKNIVMPSNVVPPAVRAELEKRGVKFVKTDNKGKLKEGQFAGEHYSKVYGAKAKNSDILFQTVYHGSSAVFDRFNTEQYGLSGEGSMSFGYGAYVTNDKTIAKDYAKRQYIKRTESKIDSDERFLAARKQTLKKLANKEKYFADMEKALQKDMKLLEKAKKANDKFDINLYEHIVEVDRKNMDPDYYESMLQSVIKEVEETTAELKELKNAKGKRQLYKIDIPNDGYIKWDENLDTKFVLEILKDNPNFTTLQNLYNNYMKWKDSPDATYLYGSNVYKAIAKDIKGGEKAASQYLYSIGVNGIDYPAGTIHGDGNGARNYVIFNDDDAKIVDHIAFQTLQELYEDARSFTTWQEFMNFYESFGKPEISLVPQDADAQYYQTTWELANGMKPEAETNEETVREKLQRDGTSQAVKDSLFITELTADNNMLEDFILRLGEIMAVDTDNWQAMDAEDEADRNATAELQDFITTQFNHPIFLSNAKRLTKGEALGDQAKRIMLGLINAKPRDYRAIYSEIMGDEQYKVPQEDTVTEQLKKRLTKYHDLVAPNEDIERMSPERRKALWDELDNREIAEKVKNGSLKMDDELDRYIKHLDKQIKDLKDQYTELEKATQNDYQTIADAETRDLLRLNEKLQLAKSKYNKSNDEIARKLAKGIKISQKYTKTSQNLKANYDELFRKFSDLKATIEINAQVEAALKRQEEIAHVKEDLNAKQKEKNITAEVKQLRIQLVKRTMRRVPFDRIDYEDAKTIIAIQRILEPNLLGGVNRWIGTEGPFLRGVISAILTDTDYRNNLIKYLEKNAASSEQGRNFLDKVRNLTKPEDFDEWTLKERKYALKHLPKENWVRELNLEALAKEREESIDLSIEMIEKEKAVIDEKTGNIKTNKNGDIIKQTTWEVQIKDDDIVTRVKDAIGEDMYNNLINVPFADWTTEQLEELAMRVNALYKQGRDILEGKKKAQLEAANKIRKQIEEAVKNTGIVINDDDTPEEKQRKQDKINKILGLNKNLKGTNAAKEDTGIKARINRLLHGYNDANVLRVARILDGQKEGVNVTELYRKEDDCYNSKTRSINSRAAKINKVMEENNISVTDLATKITVDGRDFTIDELLYFAAADKDYVDDEKKLQKGGKAGELSGNDDFAATSRNAVMFGNMLSDTESTELKQRLTEADKEMQRKLEEDDLTAEERNNLILKMLDTAPGTTEYISRCKERYSKVLQAVKELDPKYKALLEVISNDYSDQYERMNEVSVNEFNTPVHRVKAYVPLVRLESNGDTNINQVKEDLLAAYGAGAGKQWVNKGMTQRRVNMSPLNQKPVQTGLYKTWADSVERTEHFIAYAPYVRELNRVYKSRDAQYTRQFIENRYGKGMIKYIDDYINEVANPNANKVREAGAELMHVLRGKTAPAYLAWKASAVIKQGLTSPWPYMQFINPAEYLAASFKCITSRGAMYEAIREKSAFMNNRVFDPMADLIDEMAEKTSNNRFTTTINNFNKKGMAGLEWIDWVSVAPGWLACYEKEYARLNGKNTAVYEATKARLQEENLTADIGTSNYKTAEQIEAIAQKAMEDDVELKAIQYADDCTRQCQPSNRSVDISPLFKNSSEAMKAYLQFQTSLNVIWQNLRYDIPYAIKQQEFSRITGCIIGYVLAGIFMNSVMEGYDNDDDKEAMALRQALYYATTQFSDSVPMLGSEITNTLDKLITGKSSFFGTGTDLTPTATKFFSILTNAKKGNWEKAAEMTAEGIGMYMGLPVSGAKEIKKLVYDEKDGVGLNLGNVYGIVDTLQGE